MSQGKPVSRKVISSIHLGIEVAGSFLTKSIIVIIIIIIINSISPNTVVRKSICSKKLKLFEERN